MSKSLFESGIGHVVIARFKASGETGVGAAGRVAASD